MMDNDHLSDNVQDIFCWLPDLLIQTFNLGWKTKPMKGEYQPGHIWVDIGDADPDRYRFAVSYEI